MGLLSFFLHFSVPRHDVVVPSQDEEDEQRKIIAAPSMNKGRKGYLPKKIRTSGDRISGSDSSILRDSSSPGQQSFSDSGIPASPLQPQRRNSGPLPTIMETFNNNSKDVEHMETLEHMQEGSAATTTEEEAEEDQPVDFSQTSAGNGLNQPRYSILSKFHMCFHLKKSKISRVCIYFIEA